MKSYSKNIQLILGLFVMAFMYSSCNKAPDIKMYTYPAPVPTSMSPTSGYPGSYINIKGSSFGDYIPAVSVLFNGISADSIIACSDSLIRVKVPDDAVSGKVSLKVWTHTVDSIGSFKVLPLPVITSATSGGALGTHIAAAGDIVTIKGTGFGTDLSKVKVSFNGTDAPNISALSDTSLQVETPAGYAAGNIILFINDFPIQGPAFLNPDVKGDVSAFYLKNYKQTFVSTPESGTGRWRIPADWTVTAPILNHSGNGGWDSDDGTVLAVESGWGAPNISGGAMYQTVTLPAGTYTFSAKLGKNGFDSNAVYLVAAEGASIPTVTPTTSNTLGFSELHTGSFDFTLTQKTQVSLGLDVVNMTGNKYLRITSLSLVSK